MRTTVICLFLGALALSASNLVGETYPKARGFVNDFAELLTREQGQHLESDLVAFEKKTTVEIAVVTVSRLDGQDVESYSRNLGKEWGVGKKGKNNGIIFLVAVEERKMRIETAKGAREVLTDDRAERIRDEVIISWLRRAFSGKVFNKADMATGIINGTHAIMDVFDGSLSAEGSSTEAQATQPAEPEATLWTAEEVKVLKYVACGACVVIPFFIIILLRAERLRAYRSAMGSKRRINEIFSTANRLVQSVDVKAETRERLTDLRGEFHTICDDVGDDVRRRVRWGKAREDFYLLEDELPQIVSQMEREIAFAKEAREEGPKLMKGLPGLIAATEQRLSNGKPSATAMGHLDRAKEQFARAQSESLGTLNWVALYVILMAVQSDCHDAISVHSNADSWQPSHSSGDSGGPSDPGFGGFGGGGGLDGGGATGSF